MTITFRILLTWVLVSAIAFAVQLNGISATYTPEGYVPVGNDGFYHARRIIDTAGDPQRFYEFDERIHAPEGSLVVWPWGYDFGMSVLLRAGKALGLADDPVRFLAYIPPFAVLATIALVIGIGRQLELSLAATSLLAFCVALSPLTQGIHSIGRLDHHFAEYMAILAGIWSGLRWLRAPESQSAAAISGVTLGLAPAIHNGLFLVQALLLVTLGIAWLRDVRMPWRSTIAFSLALVVSTVLILIPSVPFRDGMFEFYLLSWFHLYVACSTAAVAIALARLRPDRRGLLAVLLGAALLSVPILKDFLTAEAFVTKEAAILQAVAEARSVWALLQDRGAGTVANLYSALVFIAPVVWLGCLVALFRTRNPRLLLVCVHAVLMLPLMASQVRFHYYGSLAMYLPLIVLADRMTYTSGRKAPLAAVGALLGLAYVPAISHGLAGGGPLANDMYYPLTRLSMPALARACADDPGIVLARNNDGHFIRFHTECSVIVNNFFLTPQHFQAVERVDRMFGMSPRELLDSGFPVKYVFVRARGILMIHDDGSIDVVPPEQKAVVTDRLSDALLWGHHDDLPAEFRLVGEVMVPGGAYPYARVWKIEREVSD